MKTMTQVSLGAIAFLVGAIPMAQAETTISTSRVSITVGNNGTVQVRTPGGLSLNQGLTPADTYRPSSANVTRLMNCVQQSRHQETTHVVPGTGDRVVSQSQSRSMVCQ